MIDNLAPGYGHFYERTSRLPLSPIPDSYGDLLESTNLGHLATIDREGKPQVNPVWFIWNGTNLLIGVKAETVKYRNLRRNPHLALSIADPAHPGHYPSSVAKSSNFELYLVSDLSTSYPGNTPDATWTPPRDGQERYKLTVDIREWTGQ